MVRIALGVAVLAVFSGPASAVPTFGEAVDQAAPPLWPIRISDIGEGVLRISLPDGDRRIRPSMPEDEPAIVVTDGRPLWPPIRACWLETPRTLAIYRVLGRARRLPEMPADRMPYFGRGNTTLTFTTRARPFQYLIVAIGGGPMQDGPHRGRIAILIDGIGYASISPADWAALKTLFEDVVCEPGL